MSGVRSVAALFASALLSVTLVLIPSSAWAADPTVESGTIAVGSGPTDVAVTPDGKKAYVTNYNSNSVTVIDLENPTAAPTTIPNVGSTPTSIAISPSGEFAYVTNYNSSGVGGTVSRIQLSTRAVTSINAGTFGAFAGPRFVVFSPDGATAYVSNQGANNGTKISVIDTALNTVTGNITVPIGPQNMVLSSDGRWLYVSSSINGSVSFIDLSTSTVTTPITDLTNPQGIVLSGSIGSQKLFIAEKGAADRVSVYNATNATLITRITGLNNPETLTLNGSQQTGTQLFVANSGANNVRIIDVVGNTLSATPVLSVGNLPFQVEFAPNGLKAYVANYSSNSVSVITYYQARTLAFATTSYTLAYGATQTVAATPSAGASTGTLSYSRGSSTACTVDASTGVVTVTAPTGTCAITASITQGGTTVNNAYQAATTTTPVTITPQTAALGLTASTQTVNAGASITPSFSVTSGALVGSDAISGVTYTYQGTGSTNYPASTTVPTAVGTYSVTPSAATFSIGSASNYSITYNPGSLVIQAQPTAITITAQSLSVQAGQTPSPQFAITSGALNGSDAISGVTYSYHGLGSTSYAASTTPPTRPGTYLITPSSAVFSSGSSASYTITYASGTLTITPANALPDTGSVIGASGLIALALLGGGLSLAVLRRRNRLA